MLQGFHWPWGLTVPTSSLRRRGQASSTWWVEQVVTGSPRELYVLGPPSARRPAKQADSPTQPSPPGAGARLALSSLGLPGS